MASLNPYRIVITGDIHINTSRFPEFENKRLKHLSNLINIQEPNLVILNGDILDKSKASLEDISFFYNFIRSIKSDKILISGNHEEITSNLTCYDFLPEYDFKYLEKDKLTVNDWDLFFVSHHKINEIFSLNIENKNKSILFSHYRSQYGNLINSEIDNNKVSELFKLVILSDIHLYFQPKPNIFYTSSPNSLTFSEKLDRYGFLILDLYNDNKYELNHFSIEHYHKNRIIVNYENIDKVKSFINNNPTWLFKLSVSSLSQKEEFINYKNVVGVDLLSDDSHSEIKEEITTIDKVRKLKLFSVIKDLLNFKNSDKEKEVLEFILKGLEGVEN